MKFQRMGVGFRVSGRLYRISMDLVFQGFTGFPSGCYFAGFGFG